MTTKIGKKVLALLLVLAVLFFLSFSYVSANNDVLEDAAQGVRNFVGDAENGVEDAAKGFADGVRSATDSVDNSTADNNTAQNNDSTHNTENNTGAMGAINDGNNNGGNSGTNDGRNSGAQMSGQTTGQTSEQGTGQNTGDYTATRTAGETTFFGMDNSTITWIVLALVAFAIIVLVWGYLSQDKSARKSNGDNDL